MREESSQTARHIRVERGIYKRETVDGIRYEYCYTDECGKLRWSTVRTLKQARDGRASKIAAVQRGEAVALKKTTFAELAETWYQARAPKLRTRTAGYYRRTLDLVLLPRFGSWRVQAIDADAIAALTRDLERAGLHAIHPHRRARPLGRSSIDNYLKPLHGTLALAVRRKVIPSNPFDALTTDDRARRPRKRVIFEWTDEDVEKLLSASESIAARPESRYDYTVVLAVTARLGLRCGEVLGLQWRDFDKDLSVLYVARQWMRFGEYGPTKTNAGTRRIALPHDLRDRLIALRLQSEYSQDEDPIFASKQGTPLGHRNLTYRGFEPARSLAGLPSHLTLHDLRHAAASRLIRAGLDPVTVASVLGHEDPNVTLRVYGHMWDRQRTDEAVRHALARERT